VGVLPAPGSCHGIEIIAETGPTEFLSACPCFYWTCPYPLFAFLEAKSEIDFDLWRVFGTIRLSEFLFGVGAWIQG
jgi:hypothetical protein